MSQDVTPSQTCRIACGCIILFPQSDLDRGRLDKPCPVHVKVDAIAQLRLVYMVASKLKELGMDAKLDAAGNVV